MWKGSKLLAGLLALLVILGLSACGGEGGSENSAGTGGTERPQSGSVGVPSKEGGAEGAEKGKSNAGGGDKGQSGGSAGEVPRGFAPKPHEDSGGGSEQFRVPGGDNSVQEFGAEGDGEEFEAAAAALHGFFDARAQKAWMAACSYVASPLATSLEEIAAQTDQGAGASCASGLELSTNAAAAKQLRKEAGEVDVGSLRVEGERGFLLYRDGAETVYAIAMAEEDGEWKVAALAGLPLS